MEGVHLSAENHKALFVPEGFAHGFLVLSDAALVSYKCSGRYLKGCDTGIVWDDTDIGVQWPLESVDGRENVILADKDRNLQSFRVFMDTYGGF